MRGSDLAFDENDTPMQAAPETPPNLWHAPAVLHSAREQLVHLFPAACTASRMLMQPSAK